MARSNRTTIVALGCALGATLTVQAEPLVPQTPIPGMPLAAESSPVVPGTTDALITLPAMTPLVLKLADPVSSNINKSGDRFRIVVAEDVKAGETVVIPAGTAGEGEVIHAARSGAGGKAGELLLTGRFLRVGEQNVRLRSFVIGGAGRDRSEQALATSFVAGPFAMFVRGGNIEIPVGATATAKTLETVQLPPGVAGPAEPPAAGIPGTESPPSPDPTSAAPPEPIAIPQQP